MYPSYYVGPGKSKDVAYSGYRSQDNERRQVSEIEAPPTQNFALRFGFLKKLRGFGID
jgi:hypothetical protein